MSKEAVGSYLRTLREMHRLGRPTVANEIKTSEGQVKRIEEGETDTRYTLFLAFADMVGANFDQIKELIKENATPEVTGGYLRRWGEVPVRGMVEYEDNQTHANDQMRKSNYFAR